MTDVFFGVYSDSAWESVVAVERRDVGPDRTTVGDHDRGLALGRLQGMDRISEPMGQLAPTLPVLAPSQIDAVSEDRFHQTLASAP